MTLTGGPLRRGVPLLIMFALTSGLAQGDGRPRLDAWLQAAVRHPALCRMAGTSSQVQVLVEVSGEAGEVEPFLASAGGRVTSYHGPILVVTLPLQALEGLGRLPAVRHVEASLPLNPCVDRARQAAGVNRDALAWERPELTGRGVLVGIIDSGVDPSVAGTRDEAGRTRIDCYWEQREPKLLRPPTVKLPEGESRSYSYGAEYRAADLEAGDVPDSNGFHGTHVAGIAAGRDPAYPGMAPEARFLVVANSIQADFEKGASTGGTLDAYEYLLSRAREAGLPLVVNESQGMELGPHDGSTLFERALQADVDSPTRRLIACVAAGNTRQNLQHGRIQKDGRVRMDYTQSPQPEAADAVDVWLPRGSRPTVTVNRYADLTFATRVGTSGPIPYGRTGTFDLGGGSELTLTAEFPSALNGEDHLVLTFRGQTFGEQPYEISMDGPADLYLGRGYDKFVEGSTSEGSLNSPGTTPGLITVGSYVTRLDMLNESGTITTFDDGPLGALANYSSLGPPRSLVLYTGLDSVKPDLVAPGAALISLRTVRGLDGPPAYVTPDGKHVAQSGTSMAAPVVAGVVALMLQENPVATAPEIKAWLFAGCRADDRTGALPNGSYGHGKLDARAALAAVVSPTPRLASARRPQDAPGTLVLNGECFAVSCQVLLDGSPVEASRLRWTDHRTVTVTDLPPDSPVHVVTLRNPRAPQGRRDSRLALDPQGADQVALAPGNPSCFVATAAYGSPLEPRVQALRTFRDRCLLPHPAGRALVGTYYRLSPPLAALVARHPLLRAAVRGLLEPVIWAVEHPGLSLVTLASLLGLAARHWRRRQGLPGGSRTTNS